MGEFAIGQPVPREEDPRLLTGGGEFLDDVNLGGQAWGHVLRSPHAHAEIRGMDTSAAEVMPGVIRILTGEDVEKDGIGEVAGNPPPKRRGGAPGFRPPRPPITRDRVIAATSTGTARISSMKGAPSETVPSSHGQPRPFGLPLRPKGVHGNRVNGNVRRVS